MTQQLSRPAAGYGGGGQVTGQPDRTTAALAVSKRGRWCVVAKLTHFHGDAETILAVAWRRQQGTTTALSVPVVVLEYAKQRGVTRFYLRDDRNMRMWTCDLATFDRGKLQADGERYVPLAWLQEVTWRDWVYAKRVVNLGPAKHEHEWGGEVS